MPYCSMIILRYAQAHTLYHFEIGKAFNPLSPGGAQLSKSLNALKYVFKSDWNVFDLAYNDF